MLTQQVTSVDTVETTLVGLEIDGKTAMLTGIRHGLFGIIAMADTVRPGASEAIAMFKSRGIKVVPLSGNDQRTAQVTGRQVGIERVIAEVMPEDRVKTIRGLQKDGEVVVMVGDGVNDAPALATADADVTIGSGSDVAKGTGSIILIRNDVHNVAAFIKLSRATIRKIKQSPFWTFSYNIIGTPVAVFDLLNPALTAATMSLPSFSVVASSAMFKRIRLTSRMQEVLA